MKQNIQSEKRSIRNLIQDFQQMETKIIEKNRIYENEIKNGSNDAAIKAAMNSLVAIHKERLQMVNAIVKYLERAGNAYRSRTINILSTMSLDARCRELQHELAQAAEGSKLAERQLNESKTPFNAGKEIVRKLKQKLKDSKTEIQNLQRKYQNQSEFEMLFTSV
jgi:sugar-specific transcriptional regulator TrmB